MRFIVPSVVFIKATRPPLWASGFQSCALMGPCRSRWALVGPPGPLWAWPLWGPWDLVGPPGRLWAGPVWVPLGLCGFR